MPLIDGNAFSCPFCRSKVKVPAPYRELFTLHAREASTRRSLEHDYAHVSTPPRRWVDLTAAALVLLGPAIAVALWIGRARSTPPAVDLFVYAIVPAMLPGTAIWIWSASVHATILRFTYALACLPPETDDGPPRCRRCGAPLELEPEAISARCAYCGTDSLIERVAEAVRSFAAALRDELDTLGHAVIALRVRRWLLVGGAATAVVLFAGLVFALVLGYRS